MEFVEIHVQAAREDRSIDDIALELAEKEHERGQEGIKSRKRSENGIDATATKTTGEEGPGVSHHSS